MHPIQHVIVGCGRIAPTHADAVAHLGERAQLRGCCDLDESAAAFADRYRLEHRYPRYEDVLADPEVHSLSLAVPHDRHGDLALAAIEAGKHVLVEKPFVLDVAQGRKLVQRAEQYRRVLVPIAQHRHDPVVIESKQLLQSGDMQAPRLVRLHLECARKPEYYADSPWRGSWAREGGSVLMNQSYHLIDLLLHLCGPVQDSEARCQTFAPPEVMETEDTLVASLVLAQGGLVCLSVTGSAGSEWNSAIELLAANGSLSFDINYPNRLHRFDLRNKRAMKHWRERLRSATTRNEALAPGAGYYGDSHRAVFAAFIDEIARVESGSPPDLQPAREALDTVTLIKTIYTRAGQEQA